MQHKSFCFSSVQEIIYCIVIYFFWFYAIFKKKKSLNGRDSGKKSFNSVIDKLNFILQPLLFTHLLVTKWQPGEGAVTGVSVLFFPHKSVR